MLWLGVIEVVEVTGGTMELEVLSGVPLVAEPFNEGSNDDVVLG